MEGRGSEPFDLCESGLPHHGPKTDMISSAGWSLLGSCYRIYYRIVQGPEEGLERRI